MEMLRRQILTTLSLKLDQTIVNRTVEMVIGKMDQGIGQILERERETESSRLEEREKQHWLELELAWVKNGR
jgi:hypothetical protein